MRWGGQAALSISMGVCLRSVRALILFCVLAWAAMGTFAYGADETPRQKLDSIRSALSEIDYDLKSDSLSDADFARLRAENDPIASQLQSVIAELTPRLDASHKRLDELKPKSKDTAPSNDSASEELKAEQSNYDALDADVRSARAMLLQSDDNASRIGAGRRALFARQTFVRSWSVFSPILWSGLAHEAPGDVAVIASIFSDWFRDLSQRTTRTATLEIFGLLVALALVAAPIRWIALRVIARSPDAMTPSRLRRALAAFWTLVVLAALPLAALGVISYALDLFDISDPRLQGGVNATLDGLRMLAIAHAFGRGLLAPGISNWRLVPISDQASTLTFRFVLAATLVWAVASLFEPAAEAVASLNVSIAARGVAALIISLGAAGTLRRVGDPVEPTTTTHDPWAPARTFAWALTLTIFACAVTGYVALSTFLINQLFLVSALCAGLYLTDAVVQESAELLLRPESAAGNRIVATLGLRREALEQIVVLVQGFGRLAALAVALLAAIGPLGMPSQDLVASVRAAYFGLTIGGITISLSSLLSAIIAFSLCVIATRAAQNG